MITDTELEREIRILAQNTPDRTAACMYIGDEGEPVCLIGTALVNLGVDPGYLRDREGMNAGALLSTSPDTNVSDNVSAWAEVAQEQQDNGATWSEAVADADNWRAGVE